MPSVLSSVFLSPLTLSTLKSTSSTQNAVHEFSEYPPSFFLHSVFLGREYGEVSKAKFSLRSKFNRKSWVRVALRLSVQQSLIRGIKIYRLVPKQISNDNTVWGNIPEVFCNQTFFPKTFPLWFGRSLFSMLHCSYQHVLEPNSTYNNVFSRKKQISLFCFLRRGKSEGKFCKGKFSQNIHCKAQILLASFRLPLQRWLFLFSHEPFRSFIMKRIGSRRENSAECFTKRLSGWMQTFKEYLQQYITQNS